MRIDSALDIIQEQLVDCPDSIPTEDCLLGENDTALIKIKDGFVFPACSNTNRIHHIRMNQILPYLANVAREIAGEVTFLINTCDHACNFPLAEKFPTLCFCKSRDDKSITIPNIDFFSGMIQSALAGVEKSDIPYEQKGLSSFFVGASSGWGDRLKYCEMVFGSSIHYGYINQIVGDVDMSAFPNASQYSFVGNIPLSKQLQHRFLINIDGYALCYSRLYWQMLSNSVPVYINRKDDWIQLHDYFLEPNVHFIETSMDDWLDLFHYLDTPQGEELCRSIAKAGKVFCAEHFSNVQKTVHETLAAAIKGIQQKQ